nr:MAG TPA: Protein of unknown function (DUF975) [Caudoviricetes sp.]
MEIRNKEDTEVWKDIHGYENLYKISSNGIVKSYEYMMIPYLLAEHPEMTRQEAFAESKRMMDGNKWNAFVLDLSFIGWTLLGICTVGILLVFYVEPYIYLTHAELYHALKNNNKSVEF